MRSKAGGAAAFAAGGDRDRAFRGAMRHSRWVRLMRIAIPATVCIGLLVVTAGVYFNPLRALKRLPNIGNLVVSGTKITMEQPRLAGFTRDSRAYELTARAAAQDITKPDLVELHDIHAKVELQDRSTVQMMARNGLYDAKGEMLTLDQQIVLTSSSGYEGRLSEAKVDVRNGSITSSKPVEVKLLNGNLNANGLEVMDSGSTIRFTGGVSMLLKAEGFAMPGTADEKAVVQ